MDAFDEFDIEESEPVVTPDAIDAPLLNRLVDQAKSSRLQLADGKQSHRLIMGSGGRSGPVCDSVLSRVVRVGVAVA